MTRKITKRYSTIIFLIILLILMYFILPVSIPLIVALISALMLNPLVRLAQTRLKINRKLSVILVFLLFLIAIGFGSTLIVTKAIGQVVNFVESIPSHFNQLNQIYLQLEADFREYAQNLPPEFIKQVSSSIEDIFNAF